METFGTVGTVLGCSAAVAVGALLFAANKLGILYQLFHKVGCLIKHGHVIINLRAFVSTPPHVCCYIKRTLRRSERATSAFSLFTWGKSPVSGWKVCRAGSTHVNFDQPCVFSMTKAIMLPRPQVGLHKRPEANHRHCKTEQCVAIVKRHRER